MFRGQKDQLFSLIKSLTKAEKRNFKLYVNRLQTAGDSKFLHLFDVLDKANMYDEEQVLNKLPDVEKRHLANLKRHLYKQILTSLRLIHINKRVDIQIREQIDFARILYGKGMYMQSLRILERIKKIANDHHQDILHLEILEFQKMIESRHITRSRIAGKMDDLLKSATRRSYVTWATSQFSNQNIQMHGWYIENGHAITRAQREEVYAFYDKHRPVKVDQDRMTFHEKINLYQANMWFYYILLDFPKSKKFALNWLNQFETEQRLKDKDPDLYMRGIYYLLTLLYLEEEHEEFGYYLKKFEDYVAKREEVFNENSQMIAFVYLYLSKLNFHLLKRDYSEVLAYRPIIEDKIQRFEFLLDPHRIMLFNYKMAYSYFGQDDYENCLITLNQIVHHSESMLRSDLLYAARILHVICHFELGNYDVASHQLVSCKRSFGQRTDVTPLQWALLNLLNRLVKQPDSQHIDTFQQFLNHHQHLLKEPSEKRTLSFFDFTEWAEKHGAFPNQVGVKVGKR